MLKSTGHLLAAQFLGRLLTFLLSLVLAQHLGKEGFGIFALGTTLAAFVLVLSSTGLPRILVREMTRHPDRVGGLLRAGARIRMPATLLVLGILWGYAWLCQWPAGKTRGVLLFAAAALPLAVDVNSALDARRMFTAEAWLSVLRTAAYALPPALLLELRVCEAGPELVAWCNLLGAVAYVLGGLLLLPRGAARVPDPAVPATPVRPLLVQGLTLLWAAVMIQLYTSLDVLLLEACHDDGEVGVYGVALRYFMVAMILPTAIGRVLYPTLCRAVGNGTADRTLAEQVQLSTFLCLPPCLLGTVLAGPLVGIFPASFAGAELPLRILFLVVAATGPSAVFGTGLIAGGRNRGFTVSASVGAVLAVLAGLWLVPALGAPGAALTAMVGPVATGVIAFGLLRRSGTSIPPWLLLPPLVCGLSAVLLAAATPLALAVLPAAIVWVVGMAPALRLVVQTIPERNPV